MDSRRTALIKIATAALTPLMVEGAEEAHHMHEVVDQAAGGVAAGGPSYFSQAEYDVVSKLVDLIIPRTETPGAVDAGVPHWIDRQVGSAKAELQERFKEGLAYLAERKFAAMSEPEQISFLHALSTDADAVKSGFFKTVKDLTVDAYYRTEAGLVQELGFHGNTFRASFPGCTHPEHWPEEHK